ncbi:hypothetical protein [Mesorhizobium australicum]|uniref:Uncharacterized protein n=1 Tax=Mesorhizobium australicum TaxID=536018 RepID=A0A1X7PQB1_9HYPH|nr:hypothetical protein [Mesorhizobium australicum]SMH53953.1 hypothetical protein SAMN02982922_4977 [Mesorhizobium australicum]
MPEITAYEHGARKLEARTGPDPSDEFSQDAAENRKPPLGIGLTEKVDRHRSETDKSDFRDMTPEKDAEGQFEDRHAGGSNDGVTSANPRVLSGNEDGDATFPLDRPSHDTDERPAPDLDEQSS